MSFGVRVTRVNSFFFFFFFSLRSEPDGLGVRSLSFMVREDGLLAVGTQVAAAAG